MTVLKIYSILLTFTVITLSFYLYQSSKELKDTEEVLEHCSDRYYKEIKK